MAISWDGVKIESGALYYGHRSLLGLFGGEGSLYNVITVRWKREKHLILVEFVRIITRASVNYKCSTRAIRSVTFHNFEWIFTCLTL